VLAPGIYVVMHNRRFRWSEFGRTRSGPASFDELKSVLASALRDAGANRISRKAQRRKGQLRERPATVSEAFSTKKPVLAPAADEKHPASFQNFARPGSGSECRESTPCAHQLSRNLVHRLPILGCWEFARDRQAIDRSTVFAGKPGHNVGADGAIGHRGGGLWRMRSA